MNIAHVELNLAGIWTNINTGTVYQFDIKGLLKDEGDHDTNLIIWSKGNPLGEKLREMPFYLEEIKNSVFISYLNFKFEIVNIRTGQNKSMIWKSGDEEISFE